MEGGCAGSGREVLQALLLGTWLAIVSPCRADLAGDYPIWTVKTGQIGVSPQLWAVSELRNGVIAVGTPDGLLLYDGHTWLTVALANQHAARSFALDAEGRLYVGGVGELAVLALKSGGEGPQLVSLLPELPHPETGLATVTEAVTAGEAVCFRAGPRVLCRVGGRFHEYAASGGFHAITAAEGRLFALTGTAVLVRLLPDGETRSIVWPENFPGAAQPRGIRAIAALDGRRLVARQEDDRLIHFTLDAGGVALERIEPWGEQVRGRLNRLRALPGGRLLLTTYDRGAYLLDAAGRVELHVGLRSGLASPLVTDGMLDSRGRLWLTQDGGLSRIDLRSSFREWPTSGDLGGRPLSLLAMPDGLLVGTTQGLMRLDASGWRRIEPLAMQTLALAEIELAAGQHEILAANAEGLYRIEDIGKLEAVLGRGRVASILPSRSRRDRIFLGHSLGVLEAERGPEGWRERQALVGPAGHVRDMAELEDGSLIVVETGVAVWRFRRGADGAFLPGERLGEREGVRDASMATLVHDGKAWRLSLPGALLVLAAEGPLHEDSRWSALLRDEGERIAELAAAGEGRWFALLDRPGRIWAEELRAEGAGGIRRVRELPGSDQREFSRVFYDPHRQLVWFAGSAALYSFDPGREPPAASPPRVLLREVRRADGVLIAAWLTVPLARHGGLSEGPGPDAHMPLLPASLADLSFRFSAPGSAPFDRIAFSYRLVGLHDGWSEFLEQPARAYNTLPAGHYRFELRARDHEGQISPVLSYAFAVSPPWFLTYWAYLGYLLVALVLLRQAARLGARAARQRAERLERLIAERTAALAKANHRLEQAALTDPLTGLWNRRLLSIEEHRTGKLRRPDGTVVRPRHGWLVALVDLDHFKSINDRYGHSVGDEVLCQAARRLRASAREDDWVLRWGGEEFLCLVALEQPVPERELALRWLCAIGEEPFATAAGAIAVTASMGLAHFPLDPAHPERFDLEASIQAADEALYRAKAAGRDRAVVLRWQSTREADERGRRLEASEVPRR